MIYNFQIFLLSSLLITSCSIFFATNVVHSLLFLILVFIHAAIILMLEQLEFLSLLILIIYVGAVAVLFLFIIMMLNIKTTVLNWKLKANFFIFFFISILAGFLLLSEFFYKNIEENTYFIAQNYILDSLSNLEIFGQVLYNNYLALVFLGGLILLIAVLGAILLTLSFKKVQFVTNKSSLSHTLSKY